MPVRIKTSSQLITYALLILGSVIFSAPLVWMLLTSAKADNELFTARPSFVPRVPEAPDASPYIDTRYHELTKTTTADDRMDVLPVLEEMVRMRGVWMDVTDEEAVRHTALGLLRVLSARTPGDVWEGNKETLEAYARETLSEEDLRAAYRQIHRKWMLGEMTVRDAAGNDHRLDADPVGWTVNLPGRIKAANEELQRAALVAYDFGTGSGQESFVLGRKLKLPMPAEQLQRLQMRFHPDDSWHAMGMRLWVGKEEFRSSRTIDLANTGWTQLTWQFASEDDFSNKIKTWIVLEPVDMPSASTISYLPDLADDEVEITLWLEKRSALEAGYAKARFNYQRVTDQIPFWRYVRVSAFLVVVNIVLTVFSSSLVAYGFARLEWPGRDFCFLLLLSTMMIPGQVTMIPHFLIWKTAGAYDTLTPLYAGSAFGSAFFIFLMRQFLKGIPTDLEDAARIDGCGFLRIYWHVMLPLVRPSLIAIAIFTFMGTWNDFLGPLLYVADQRLYPLAFGLYAFSVQVENNATLTLAASVLMTTPVILVFFFAQRYFVQGITLTGIK